MTDNQEQINQLLAKLDLLTEKHRTFSREINSLRIEILELRGIAAGETPAEEKKEDSFSTTTSLEVVSEEATANDHLRYTKKDAPPLPKIKLDLEKFIGENLISKIGIAITVIGVAFGAVYSIEHDMINPLTRIILGYLSGLGLLGVGMKLKTNYESYSAVLVSGAMAILYFITYAGYSLYDLIPQAMAFALMVVFTIFTVAAAINYNRQVIALVGLVGAYAVPFLLSSGSGQVAVLFSYMAIINVGILIIAFRKYWKPLYYAAFGFTWLIYFSWLVMNYSQKTHFGLALTFLSLFFALFYLTFLAYKLLQKEKFALSDILLLLLNSFLFYGLGYFILADHDTGSQLLGLFTLGNAVVHFIVSTVIYRQKLVDKNLFYLVVGLVLVFITLAIPVQLDGNWVTLLWVGEATLLFWIGRTKHIPIYEQLSYPLMLLAFFSIAQDWALAYSHYNPAEPQTRITPIFNVHFLSSVLFIGAFGFINYLARNKNYPAPLGADSWLSKVSSFAIPAILILSVYSAFRVEIVNYWDQLFTGSALTINVDGEDYASYYMNYDLNTFKQIWVINYSLLFASLLSFLNIRKLKNRNLGLLNLGLNVLIILVFLIHGLYAISELRESYLEQSLSEYYQRGIFHLGIRYVSYGFVALTLFATYRYLWQDFVKQKFTVFFDLLLHLTILWIASSELISWMDIADSTQSYKLGLSILWGVYALFLIVLGIWKKKKNLRIGAIILFGVTLVKLFVYDISHLNTISKTIVFVSLGVLLLIISFLYNKYKHIIADEVDS